MWAFKADSDRTSQICTVGGYLKRGLATPENMYTVAVDAGHYSCSDCEVLTRPLGCRLHATATATRELINCAISGHLPSAHSGTLDLVQPVDLGCEWCSMVY